MHIFIDESGIFSLSSGALAVSVVGALIIPDGQLADIERRYATLRPSLLKKSLEVKGRELREAQVARVVSMLVREEVLFEVTAVDMSIHTQADIAAHKTAQAGAMVRHLTDEHSLSIRTGVAQLRARLEDMAPQLYVQSVVTFALIERVIQHATLYYGQRRPAELGAFNWVIDAKDRDQITDWEDWWWLVVRSALQSKSLGNPVLMLKGADYSYFDKYSTVFPDYLKPHVPGPLGSDDATDVTKLITESFRFSHATEPGLELVDILVNATRRALINNLGAAGWREIPRTMVHQTGRHYIQIAALRTPLPDDPIPPYMPVLHHFSRGGRSMFVKTPPHP